MNMKSAVGILGFLSIALPCSAAAIPAPATPHILRPIQARSTADPAEIIPHEEVSLHYAAVNATVDADVAASMKLPSVLLESIASVREVDCEPDSVKITFDDPSAFSTGENSWPSSDFLLFTNHLGDCDAENERGVYLVQSISYDENTLTVTASTSKTTIAEQAKDVVLTFSSSTTPAKRDLSATVDFNLSAQTLVSNQYLTIATQDSSVSSTVTVSGGLKFHFLTFTLEELYLDIDLTADLDVGLDAKVAASYNTDLFNYSPAALSVAAFSIPGVLDLGPYLQFKVGVEFAASGKVDASVGFNTQLKDGKIHLDLVDFNSTTSSGWTPTYSVSTNVSAEVDLQLNPSVDLTLGLGIVLFSGVLDISAGVEAKPTIVNAFSVDADFAYTSETGIVLAKPTNETCANGAWFASTFDFALNAFVSPIWSSTIYSVELPIYESKCWTWAG